MSGEAGSVTSTLNADSSGFVAAYEKANLALQRSRAALAEQKAAMMAMKEPTDAMKASMDASRAAMAQSQAVFESAKLNMMQLGKAAEDAGGEHDGGGLHSLARGMRFSTSAALTMEGQIQHSGHAIVGVMMGLSDPAMGAAMAIGLALDLGVKAFRELKDSSQEAREAIETNLEAAANASKTELDAMIAKEQEAQKAFDNFGLSPSEAKHREDAAAVGKLTDMQARAVGDLANEQARLKTIADEYFKVVAAGAFHRGVVDQKHLDALKREERMVQDNIALIQRRDAEADAALAHAESAAALTSATNEKDVEANRVKEQAKLHMEEIKKSQEQLNREVEKAAAFYERISKAVDKIAATPTSTSELAEGFSKLQNPLENSSMRTTMGAPLGLDINHVTAFETVLDATAEEMAAFTGGLDEGHTAIHDTMGELADLGRQFVENTSDSRHFTEAVQSAKDAIAVAFSPENLDKTVGEFAKAVAGGHGGNAAGSAAGGVIGGIVDVASGGATMGLGATLGSVLGGIFGDALDKLVSSLGVLTPLFDAVGDILSSLTPILEPLKLAFEGVRTILDIGLAKPLLALARPFGDIVGIVAELVVALAPWLGLVLDFAVSLIAIIPVFDLLHTPMRDFVLLLNELVTASTNLYNGFVGINNAIVDWVRSINIAGVQPFKDFGEHMDKLPDPNAAAAQTKATEDNTKAINKLNDQFSNIPSIYKLNAALAAADNGRTSNRGNTIHVKAVYVQARDANVMDAIQRELVKKHGAKRGGGGGPEDDHGG